jgi:hypothetical protein
MVSIQNWMKTSEIGGLRSATQMDLERAASEMFPGAQAKYLFQSGPKNWRVLDGNYHVNRSFLLDECLIVFGDLTIDVDYDDCEGDGSLIVMGDFYVRNCLLWGTLYVRESMYATGLVYAYYNDYTFEVAGTINALGILSFDKAGSLEKIGNVGFYLNSLRYYENYGDHLLFLDTELLLNRDGIDESTKMHNLFPDFVMVREWIHNGRSVFRDEIAQRELLSQIEIAMSYSSSAEAMLAVMGNDRLLPQLMALRFEIPTKVRERLLVSPDPVVQTILNEMS